MKIDLTLFGVRIRHPVPKKLYAYAVQCVMSFVFSTGRACVVAHFRYILFVVFQCLAYLWHRLPFKLGLSRTAGLGISAILAATTRLPCVSIRLQHFQINEHGSLLELGLWRTVGFAISSIQLVCLVLASGYNTFRSTNTVRCSSLDCGAQLALLSPLFLHFAFRKLHFAFTSCISQVKDSAQSDLIDMSDTSARYLATSAHRSCRRGNRHAAEPGAGRDRDRPDRSCRCRFIRIVLTFISAR